MGGGVSVTSTLAAHWSAGRSETTALFCQSWYNKPIWGRTTKDLSHTAPVSMRRKFTFTLQRACGRIIGRNGDTIRSISRASNAKIIVEGSSGDTREFGKWSLSVENRNNALYRSVGVSEPCRFSPTEEDILFCVSVAVVEQGGLATSLHRYVSSVTSRCTSEISIIMPREIVVG